MFSSFEAVRQGLFSRDLAQHAHKHYEKGNILEDVVMQLHGAEHRDRRRLENPLFRREAVQGYERERFPIIIDEHLDRLIAEGVEDAVRIGHSLTVLLSADISGVDLDAHELEKVSRLIELEKVFVQGASITDSARDKAEVIRDVQAALEAFRSEFYDASRARREAELAQASLDGRPVAGDDLLTILLWAKDEHELDDELILRETAFFLESGSHTSSLSLANTLSHLLAWREKHPQEYRRQMDGPTRMDFLQRCASEAIRLHPIIPVTRRRAVAPVEIDGRVVDTGTIVYLDNTLANQDPTVFGPEPQRFDPTRELPSGVQAFGHGFSGGMHSCIGRVLAIGVPPSATTEERIYGQVTLMLSALLDRGVARHPDQPPVYDETTRRVRLERFPVVFESVEEAGTR